MLMMAQTLARFELRVITATNTFLLGMSYWQLHFHFVSVIDTRKLPGFPVSNLTSRSEL